jgi:hypothetical protein
MTDKAKILEASAKHAKPDGLEFQYGTAGVSHDLQIVGIKLIMCYSSA